MGQIREIAIVHVAYRLSDGTGMTSSFDVPAEAAADLKIGQALPIKHHPEYVHRIERLAVNPFALTHAGRYGVVVPKKPSTKPARKKFELAKPGEEPSTLEKVSRFIAWLIVAAMGVAILLAIRFVWRLASRLLRGSAPAPSSSRENRPRAAAQSPIAASRMASVTSGRNAGSFASGGSSPRPSRIASQR